MKCAAKYGFRNSVSNLGYLFFLLPKIYELSEYYTTFARKIFFSRDNCSALPSPVSYAYGSTGTRDELAVRLTCMMYFLTVTDQPLRCQI